MVSGVLGLSAAPRVGKVSKGDGENVSQTMAITVSAMQSLKHETAVTHPVQVSTMLPCLLPRVIQSVV